MKILVTAASKHGSTAEIAHAIGATLKERGFDVTLRPPDAFVSIAGYDALVIGSAVYAGHWRDEAKEFVERHAIELQGKDVWLFSSGPLGDPLKPDDDPVDAAPMMAKTKAREHKVFAGKMDKAKLSIGERAVVRAVRASYGDFRDRSAIREWAGEIASVVAAKQSTVS